MKGYLKVGPVKSIPVNTGVSFRKKEFRAAVFNVNGKFMAMADSCPHRGAPLGDGPVEKGIVTCSWHGWEFDIKKGCLLGNEELAVQKYDVKILAKNIYVCKEAINR